MEKDAERPYHHGDLRRALIDEALKVIAAEGPNRFSLRELARRLGVSHAAPAHHFRDKTGLLTAIAAEGYEVLAVHLDAAKDAGFLEVGLAYVRFAVEHPAYVQVMFQPSLYRPDDDSVARARSRTSAVLYGGAAEISSEHSRAASIAGWCLMHGVASLWLSGALNNVGRDPIEIARMVGLAAFRQRRPTT